MARPLAIPYRGSAMVQGRIDKTTGKTRHGGLPAPDKLPPIIGLGDGQPCDGCGETIDPAEAMFSIRPYGLLDFRFHDICYSAWATFKR